MTQKTLIKKIKETIPQLTLEEKAVLDMPGKILKQFWNEAYIQSLIKENNTTQIISEIQAIANRIKKSEYSNEFYNILADKLKNYHFRVKPEESILSVLYDDPYYAIAKRLYIPTNELVYIIDKDAFKTDDERSKEYYEMDSKVWKQTYDIAIGEWEEAVDQPFDDWLDYVNQIAMIKANNFLDTKNFVTLEPDIVYYLYIICDNQPCDKLKKYPDKPPVFQRNNVSWFIAATLPYEVQKFNPDEFGELDDAAIDQIFNDAEDIGFFIYDHPYTPSAWQATIYFYAYGDLYTTEAPKINAFLVPVQIPLVFHNIKKDTIDKDLLYAFWELVDKLLSADNDEQLFNYLDEHGYNTNLVTIRYSIPQSHNSSASALVWMVGHIITLEPTFAELFDVNKIEQFIAEHNCAVFNSYTKLIENGIQTIYNMERNSPMFL